MPPHGLKAQKLLAQGITLGISAIRLAPCKGKSLKKSVKSLPIPLVFPPPAPPPFPALLPAIHIF
ncbi:hypothetical protein F7D74_03030 [Prevotella copri]|uniref:Uncharacterized protein n=1 Tax=Segatella copri TaxID=165179 RepID=A0AA90ZTX5_9BACT|nr:hypothetical protein [Segatella copri]